jgi:hypothetical protein
MIRHQVEAVQRRVTATSTMRESYVSGMMMTSSERFINDDVKLKIGRLAPERAIGS